MVRPGYHTLQAVIIKALAAERRRLSEIVEKALDRDAKTALQQLLVREETLSELAQVTSGGRTHPRRLLVELGSLRAPEPGNRLGWGLVIKLTYGKRATLRYSKEMNNAVPSGYTRFSRRTAAEVRHFRLRL